MARHLYIIGNGFDQHHEIHSSYHDFYEWMSMYRAGVLCEVEEVYGCCGNDWWADFEKQLASLDVLQYSAEIAFENQPDLLSEHCDRTWNDAQLEVELKLESLYSDLRDCFRDWILQLNEPNPELKLKLVKDDSIFLTFNYTKTLENIYNVPSDRILHIHGCIDDNEEFILGHGKSIEDLRKINEYNDPPHPVLEKTKIIEEFLMEIDDPHPFHQQLAEDAALQGVASQKKPIEDILYRNKAFFDNLSNITHVHVYGFSFSEIDMPYLIRIGKVAKLAEWEISDFQGKSINAIKDFVKRNKISKYKIVKLEDLQYSRQLKLVFPVE